MNKKQEQPKQTTLFDVEPEKGASGASTTSAKKVAPKKVPVPTKEEMDARAQAGRDAKRQAERAKTEAYELEKKNRGQIILYRSTKGWWKMGDLSAAIYAHMVAGRLGRKTKPKILADGDFYHKFKAGVCAIPNAKKLEEDLKKIKIPVVKRTENCIIFDYGKKLTPQEIADLLNVAQNQQDRINEIVVHEQIFPEMYHLLVQIQREMLNIVRKLPKFEKEVYGKDTMIEARAAMTTYMKMTNNIMEAKVALPEMINNMTMVMFGLKDLTENEMLEKKRCLRVLTMILDVMKIMRLELRKCNDQKK